MESDEQSPIAAPQLNDKPSQKAESNNHYLVLSLLGLVVLILGMGTVYIWQHQQVNKLNSKLDNYQAALAKNSKISLDKLNALSAIPNLVVDAASSPTDLIAFLGANNTQCYKANGSGYYKVVVQANNQFAKMQYGCSTKDGTPPGEVSSSLILAKKINNKWSLISPTNQWVEVNGQVLPSCSMVNNNKVSKLVTPQCWQGPSLSDSKVTNIQQRTVVLVTNP